MAERGKLGIGYGVTVTVARREVRPGLGMAGLCVWTETHHPYGRPRREVHRRVWVAEEEIYPLEGEDRDPPPARFLHPGA